MNSRAIRPLATGLASIAIAALGITPGAAAAAAVSVDLATRWVDRSAAARELRRTLVAGITLWAEGEHLQSDLEPGMAIAGKAVTRHGLLRTDLQKCSYDVHRLTAEIIDHSRTTDRDWGTFDGDDADGAHTVARRAIAATVFSVLQQQHRIESEVLPVLADKFEDLDSAVADLRREVSASREGVRTLNDTLISPASAAEVRSYLMQRIEDWDAAGWIQPKGPSTRRPSQIERTLSVRNEGTESEHLSVSEALQRNDHLVVLGGPGAGKSWLAKRIARETAHKALEQLDTGKDPLDIDIPLFTTWAAWTKVPSGGARTALIDASFASGLGHSDLGNTQRTDRIKRLLGSTIHAVAIVDALDEASENGDVESRIRELQNIGEWRTVVTSRPSAWSAKRATREREDGVFTLEPLHWERDVPRFIEAWFTDDPPRASALAAHIRRNDHLRRTSAIPLLLSFYCIYAQSSPPEAPLPTTDHQLFEHVINQLLIAEWSSGGRPRSGEIAQAKQLLTRWAWHMVKDSTSPSGLGRWGDHLYPSDDATENVLRILDNIAPAAVDSAGDEFRTFRHRTLLEHFVALHISTLPPEQAARTLLPHLWFDPDWEITAPRAIALHPERDDVRELLLTAAYANPGSIMAVDANEELDWLWLRVAADTVPRHWNAAHRKQIHELRLRRAEEQPALVARSSAWTNSNSQIVDVYERVLLEADPRTSFLPLDMLRALNLLGAGERGRQAALKAITADLVTADFLVEDELDTFIAFDPTLEERNRLRDAIVESLPVRHPWSLAPAVEILRHLHPTPEHVQCSRSAITSALAEADSWTVTELSTALSVLHPTDEERSTARREIVRVLTTVRPWQACSLLPLDPDKAAHRIAVLTSDSREVLRLAQLLVDLGPESDERVIALLARTVALAGKNDEDYGLATSLADLSPTTEERESLRAMIATALAAVESWAVYGLVNALLELGLSADDRRIALDALDAAATEKNAWSMKSIVETFYRLQPTPEERRTFRLYVNDAIAHGEPQTVCTAVCVLSHLGATPAERRSASLALTEVLTTADRSSLSSATTALADLDPDPTDHPVLRRAISTALAMNNPLAVPDLVAALVRLTPGQPERRIAINASARALATDHGWLDSRLLDSLSELVATEDDRVAAIDAITQQMTSPNPKSLRNLTEALLYFISSREDRGAAFDVVSTAMARAASEDLVYLGSVLMSLADAPGQKRAAVATLTMIKTRVRLSQSYRIARLLRQMSTLDEWIILLGAVFPQRDTLGPSQ